MLSAPKTSQFGSIRNFFRAHLVTISFRIKNSKKMKFCTYTCTFVVIQMVTAQSVQEIANAVKKKLEEDRLTLLRLVDECVTKLA